MKPMNLNLLLLEDSLTDAVLILDVLQEAGFEVALAASIPKPTTFANSTSLRISFCRISPCRNLRCAMRYDSCKSGGSIFRSLLCPAASVRRWLWNA